MTEYCVNCHQEIEKRVIIFSVEGEGVERWIHATGFVLCPSSAFKSFGDYLIRGQAKPRDDRYENVFGTSGWIMDPTVEGGGDWMKEIILEVIDPTRDLVLYSRQLVAPENDTPETFDIFLSVMVKSLDREMEKVGWVE